MKTWNLNISVEKKSRLNVPNSWIPSTKRYGMASLLQPLMTKFGQLRLSVVKQSDSMPQITLRPPLQRVNSSFSLVILRLELLLPGPFSSICQFQWKLSATSKSSSHPIWPSPWHRLGPVACLLHPLDHNCLQLIGHSTVETTLVLASCLRDATKTMTLAKARVAVYWLTQLALHFLSETLVTSMSKCSKTSTYQWKLPPSRLVSTSKLLIWSQVHLLTSRLSQKIQQYKRLQFIPYHLSTSINLINQAW